MCAMQECKGEDDDDEKRNTAKTNTKTILVTTINNKHEMIVVRAINDEKGRKRIIERDDYSEDNR